MAVTDALLSAAERKYAIRELTSAEALCRQHLKTNPRSPDAIHLLAKIMYRRGRPDIAKGLLKTAISLDPVNAEHHRRLGKIVVETGNGGEGLKHLEDACALAPTSLKVLHTLGEVLLQQCHLSAAQQCFLRVIELNPQDSIAYFDLANVLLASSHYYDAVQMFETAVTLDPELKRRHLERATALHRRGHLDGAIRVLEWGSALQPSDPELAFMLDAIASRCRPDRAPNDYVVKHFDRFSDFFDEQLLNRLDYQVPTSINENLRASLPSLGDRIDILDIGCGTGLCGPVLRPYARHLVGIDLSPGMVEKAQARGVYDQLIVTEITDYLSTLVESFDAVVAGDVLVYFGNLANVFALTARGLRPQGILISSFERSVDSDILLHGDGRYAHSEGYLRRQSDECGLEVVRLEERHLRYQWGKPVHGYILTLRKP